MVRCGSDQRVGMVDKGYVQGIVSDGSAGTALASRLNESRRVYPVDTRRRR